MEGWSEDAATKGGWETPHRKLGRGEEVFPAGFQGKHGCSADILIAGVWPPELQENKFMLFKTLSLWYLAVATLEN